ncbi:MAG: FtsX-like permease family protein [Planctomycetota bacterium]
MRLFAISVRNLRTRVVSTVLTALSILLGTALLAALWLLIDQTNERYNASTAGYKAIVGPKEGAPLALVLNTVYNLGFTPGVVPFSVYRELHARGETRYVIPQARGDTYLGFPVIGTTDEMFTKFRRGEHGPLEFAAGKAFEFTHEQFDHLAEDLAAGRIEIGHHHHEGDADHDHEPTQDHEHDHAAEMAAQRQAVIGAEVARRGGMKVGDWITPVHGAEDDPDPHVHEESKCEVVGVLAPTRTPLDSSIFIPLSVFLTMDKHEGAVRATGGDKQVALTALIVDFKTHMGANWLRHEFQTRADAQAAWTTFEVTELMRMVGNATDVLRVVAWLVLVVAAVSIAVALYNTMNERRREIAIMRALGARRWQIMSIILVEAVLIAGIGAALGVVACHGATWLWGDVVEARTGVFVSWAAFSREELYLILGVAGLGGLAGVLPAVKGSRTQVADNLVPTS